MCVYTHIYIYYMWAHMLCMHTPVCRRVWYVCICVHIICTYIHTHYIPYTQTYKIKGVAAKSDEK